MPKQRDCACSMPLVNKYASTFPRFNWAIMVSWTRTAMSYWPGYSLGGKQATPWLTTYRYRDSTWYQDVSNVFAHKNRILHLCFDRTVVLWLRGLFHHLIDCLQEAMGCTFQSFSYKIYQNLERSLALSNIQPTGLPNLALVFAFQQSCLVFNIK